MSKKILIFFIPLFFFPIFQFLIIPDNIFNDNNTVNIQPLVFKIIGWVLVWCNLEFWRWVKNEGN